MVFINFFFLINHQARKITKANLKNSAGCKVENHGTGILIHQLAHLSFNHKGVKTKSCKNKKNKNI
jgi:hypothetical protein